MSNIFLISDLHFGHEAPYSKFLRDDGSFLRPHGSAHLGDETMILNWNNRVRPNDKIYVLGDVVMSKNAKGLEILRRLMGEKILIKGNHDLCSLSQYAEHFKDIRGSHQLDGMLLTHIPIHPDSLSRWTHNIHGHLHQREVMTAFGARVDTRYFNVSVERINYTPISLEELKVAIKNRS